MAEKPYLAAYAVSRYEYRFYLMAKKPEMEPGGELAVKREVPQHLAGELEKIGIGGAPCKLGFAHFLFPNGRRAHLDQMFPKIEVDKDGKGKEFARGLGLGSLLEDMAAEHLQSRGITHIKTSSGVEWERRAQFRRIGLKNGKEYPIAEYRRALQRGVELGRQRWEKIERLRRGARAVKKMGKKVALLFRGRR